jgi:hypothetical protein
MTPLPPAQPAGRAVIDVEASELHGRMRDYLAEGYRLALVAAHDDGPVDDPSRGRYVWSTCSSPGPPTSASSCI